MDDSLFGELFEEARADIRSYLLRLLVRPELAEETVQQTALQALRAVSRPPAAEVRPWLFRIATNLAIDALRKSGRYEPDVMIRGRMAAESSADFVKESEALRGNSEMNLIAKEHLAICFGCVLQSVSPERATALLLKEIYGFSLDQVASILETTAIRVKNWLQEARSIMVERYETTCALIVKDGVCYQCVELSEFFTGKNENPLSAGVTLDHRLSIVREVRNRMPGRWHKRLLAIFDELD